MIYYKKDKANGEIRQVSAEEALKIILAGFTKESPYNTIFSLFWEDQKRT